MNSYIITDGSIMLSIGMKPYNVEQSHPNYDKVLDAVRAEDWDVIPSLVNITNTIANYGNGKIDVDVEHGVVTYNGDELHNSLTDRIIRMMKEGFSIDPLVNFLDNLMQNPSARAVEELYTFLEYGKMPITEDGHFLAYKRVNNDYTSVHDSKTDNSISTVVEMARNQVDDRSDNTCSNGLHFCSHAYLSSFSGAKVVVLKINPRDVVSIPTDYQNTKGRACAYEVVGELDADEVRTALGGGGWEDSVNTDYSDRDIDDHDYEKVSVDYLSGYDRGRTDGRAGVDYIAEAIVVTEMVIDTAEYINGYKRGWKDGKGHKAVANLNVAIDDRHDVDVFNALGDSEYRDADEEDY